jgi:hypothetical protein
MGSSPVFRALRENGVLTQISGITQKESEIFIIQALF